VLAGRGRVEIDGDSATPVERGVAVVIPKGTTRRIAAGGEGDGDGLRYVTVHARRAPMSIGGPPR